MSIKTLITAAEFAELQFPDGEDYELVEGELVPLSSPTALHSEIAYRLEYALRNYIQLYPIGRVVRDVDCALSSNMVRRPDVAVYLQERAQQIDWRRVPIVVAPDIAVEVISPSESWMEVNRKTRDYLRAGTQEVWIVDELDGTILVKSLTQPLEFSRVDAFESRLLPGFSILVADVLSAP